MSRASLRNRITALANAIKPAPNSLEARIERLGPAERAAYQHHQDRIAAWIKSNPDRNFYQAIFAGEGPMMPKGLSEKLSGPTPVITPDMTVMDAAEVYRRFAFGD